ncbi:m119.5 protein [Murid betaherpesvirus 1]|uniref:M119.5 protein n=1 Tax=Murid herpesvirus 1 TaxID=10366 RepID=H2A108_MUHV1|nr:m119.5 protein [Murid betaherpesvirus 1]
MIATATMTNRSSGSMTTNRTMGDQRELSMYPETMCGRNVGKSGSVRLLLSGAAGSCGNSGMIRRGDRCVPSRGTRGTMVCGRDGDHLPACVVTNSSWTIYARQRTLTRPVG